MAGKNYVYSTLANDQNYVERGKNRTVVASVRIAGKANVPDKHFFTPRGVSTEVTDEELAVLRNNKVFQQHEKNGYVSVDTRKTEGDKAARNMNNDDKSQPDTEKRLAETKKAAPKTNKG